MPFRGIFFTFALLGSVAVAQSEDAKHPDENAREPKQVQLTYKELSEPERRVVAANLANQFSVMILSKTAGAFDINSRVEGGQGTGFIVEINREKNEAYVVTNRHVVAADDLDAQSIQIFFTVPGSRDEAVTAELFYISPPGEEDIAILKFKPSLVKRAEIMTAPIPTFDQMARMYQTGIAVLSHGNPAGVRNSVTFGVLSQAAEAHFDGNVYFKTDAPINPGNSGGPLLRLGMNSSLDPDGNAPYVIGINTVKRQQAEGMGYAIPTFVWLPKYLWARKGGPSRAKGYLYLRARPVTTKIPNQSGLRELIDAEVQTKLDASYFDTFKTILMVDQAQKDSGLLTGDYILSVDGHILGPDMGQLDDLIAQSEKPTLLFRVLRNRSVMTLEVPITNTKAAEVKRKSDFVLISGLFAQDLLPREQAEIAKGLKGIVVRKILEDGFGAHLRDAQGLITEGSLISSVQIQGHEYPVSNLEDLKAALRFAKLGDWIWLRVYKPKSAIDYEQRQLVPVFDGEQVNVYLPVHEVLTEADFSLADLRRKIDTNHPIPGVRNWRNLTGMNCRRSIAELSRHLKQPELDFDI